MPEFRVGSLKEKPSNWILYDFCDKDDCVKSLMYALRGIPALKPGFSKPPGRQDMSGTPSCRYHNDAFQE